MDFKFSTITLNGKPYLNFWIPLAHEGRPFTFGEQRDFVKTMRDLEKKLATMRHDFNGWATWIENEHVLVARVIQKLGAVKVSQLADRAWYAKEVL
jgi:hypothetical protein